MRVVLWGKLAVRGPAGGGEVKTYTTKMMQSSVSRWASHYGVESTVLNGRFCIYWVPGGRPMLVYFVQPGTKQSANHAADAKRFQDMKYLVMVSDHAEEVKAVIAMGLRAAGVECNHNVGG